MWALLVRAIGGFHEIRPLFICIHDDGITAGWNRVQRFDWRRRSLTHQDRGPGFTHIDSPDCKPVGGPQVDGGSDG